MVKHPQLTHGFRGKIGWEQAHLTGDQSGGKPNREPVTVGARIEHMLSWRESRRDSVDVRQKATDGNRHTSPIRDDIAEMAVSDKRMMRHWGSGRAWFGDALKQPAAETGARDGSPGASHQKWKRA